MSILRRLEGFCKRNFDSRILPHDLVKLFVIATIINTTVFGAIWFIDLGEIMDGVPNAVHWYFTWPMCLEAIAYSLHAIWFYIGKKTYNTSFPDSFFYIATGSFIITSPYIILAYFYRSFSLSAIYLAGPLFLSTLFISWKWVAATSAVVAVSGVLMASGVFEVSTYRFSHISGWSELLFSINLLSVIGFMCIAVYRARELSDKEALRAEASNHAKSDFLAMMSHEIRTPINAILGMNEMVLRTTDDEEVIGYSENIQSSGKVLLSLINDILDFSKIEAGDMPIIPVDYNVGTLIFDCYYAVIKRAEDKGLRFVLKVDEFLPAMLNGDEGRIRQIITNLLTNAVKYTNEGSVTLKVKGMYPNDEMFIISFMVEDTGIGIASEDIDGLFTAFKRFDEKTNRNIEGTGLGLAISERLTTRMNGKISVMSEKGKGSVFTVSIPQKVIDKQPIGNIWLYNRESGKRKETYKPMFTAPNAKALCVDDVPINLVVLTSMLKQTEIQITTAKDGVEAVELASKEHFDIILMDHLMPNMDGIEALAKIREMGDKCPNANTPVVILTANAIAGSKDEYIKKGFSDYLSKPIDSSDLEMVLLRHLPAGLKQ